MHPSFSMKNLPCFCVKFWIFFWIRLFFSGSPSNRTASAQQIKPRSMSPQVPPQTKKELILINYSFIIIRKIQRCFAHEAPFVAASAFHTLAARWPFPVSHGWLQYLRAAAKHESRCRSTPVVTRWANCRAYTHMHCIQWNQCAKCEKSTFELRVDGSEPGASSILMNVNQKGLEQIDWNPRSILSGHIHSSSHRSFYTLIQQIVRHRHLLDSVNDVDYDYVCKRGNRNHLGTNGEVGTRITWCPNIRIETSAIRLYQYMWDQTK